jgi:hypothetical protein
MTRQIFLSQLSNPDLFKSEVEKHIERLHAFNLQVGKPRPTAHPLVEASIKRIQVKGKPDKYVPDYEIIDDRQKAEELNAPQLTLEDKKTILTQRLREAERKAIEKVMPFRKQRLWRTLCQNILKRPPEEHTPEDSAYLNKAKAIDAAFAEIGLKAAYAEAAIEDLTDSNIDSWQLPPLD